MDLTDAYLHIPVFPGHHQYLQFCVEGRHYQFCALPFGLSSAPRVFTKMLVRPITCLLLRVIHVHPYLNDILIRAPAQSVCPRHQDDTEVTTGLWVPSESVQELSGSHEAPGTPGCDYRHIIPPFISASGKGKSFEDAGSNRCSFTSLAKLMGLMIFTLDTIQWGRLHWQDLQQFLRPSQLYITQKWDMGVQVPLQMKTNLK